MFPQLFTPLVADVPPTLLLLLLVTPYNADTRNYTAEFPLYVYASILPTIRKTRITPMMFIIYLDIAITTTTTTTTSSVRQNTPPIANKTVAHTLVLKIV